MKVAKISEHGHALLRLQSFRITLYVSFSQSHSLLTFSFFSNKSKHYKLGKYYVKKKLTEKYFSF
jgi:hypothetical protein